MGKKRHTCNCYDCAEARPDREAYRRGGIDDGWEDEPYRKSSTAGWISRKRNCKKSKTGEKCDYSKTVVKGSKRNKEGTGYEEIYVRVCSRCGKEDWSSYSWW